MFDIKRGGTCSLENDEAFLDIYSYVCRYMLPILSYTYYRF